MNRARITGVLSGGLLLVVGALLLALTPNVRAADKPQAAVLQHVQRLEPSLVVSCTVNALTTDYLPNNQDPNNAASVATYGGLALVANNTITGTITPALDDWFLLGNVTTNYMYSFGATPDGSGNYNLGMDIYSGVPGSLTLVQSDVNTGDGNSAQIVTTFPGIGPYYIKVYQISNFCSGGNYTLRFSSTAPTPTPSLTPTQTRTPTPTPTNTPTKTITPTPSAFACTTGSDRFEPNNDFDTATTLGLGVKYPGLNFVECAQSGDSWDVDYFKVRVKPGMLVTCRTMDLTAGTDTNLILYDVNMNGINGSDDINRAAGDLSSSVTYYVTYEGWLYGLVGESFHRPQSEQAAAAYSYECVIVSQSTPTVTPTPTEVPGQPTRTPAPTIPPTLPPTLTPSPTLSPTPPFIRIVPLPTVTPAGLPAKSIPVSLQVYYDTDSNNKPDPGEGVVGVSARVFDLTNGNLLAQGLTDQTGRVSFTISAIGAVQLVVPYFNFSSIILPASGGSAVIRISPHELPRSIP